MKLSHQLPRWFRITVNLFVDRLDRTLAFLAACCAVLAVDGLLTSNFVLAVICVIIGAMVLILFSLVRDTMRRARKDD